MKTAAILSVLLAAVMQGLVAGQDSIPTITSTSTQVPPTWTYANPSSAVMWFEGSDTITTPGNVSTSNFVCNGGQIVDVIAQGNGVYNIRGYVPVTDPFTSNSTTVQLSTTACNLAPGCTAFAEADNAPQCYIYAVDMAYCGTEGLVTDRDHALFVLVCSEPVTGFCSPAINNCIKVSGPSNATVEYVDVVDTTSDYYHTQISWDPSYLGPVTVSFSCAVTDAQGNSLAEPIKDLQFSVVPIVAVRSSAYKIGTKVLNVNGPDAALLANANDRPAK
ncbi:hypothetical protein WJX72_008681 [[Myrmecia] bisecta]|uniref:Uncharacterized protein n=1 Tax=[Myrmecia] bisecta TaxID=41462 RepID=A0AAW1R931_9CHLO